MRLSLEEILHQLTIVFTLLAKSTQSMGENTGNGISQSFELYLFIYKILKVLNLVF